jgi:hypothetical protein
MLGSKQRGTVIAKGLKIVGSVTAEGLVEVNGQIDGELHCTSLVIARGAHVNGIVAIRSNRRFPTNDLGDTGKKATQDNNLAFNPPPQLRPQRAPAGRKGMGLGKGEGASLVRRLPFV